MSLIVKVGADMTNFDRSMNKLTKDTQKVGGKLATVGAGLTAAITVPLVGLGVASVQTGMEFESTMSKVAAISGATGDDLQALEDKAREMGSTTKYSASESAEALSYMAMAGWKTADMLDGIEGVMNLAAASGEDLASVSDIVTDSLTAFGLKADQTGRFTDVLAAASSNANTTVAGLGEAFTEVGPVAGSMGYEIEDVTHALSLMANAGIKGSSAGTALKGMLVNLTAPTAAMQKAMDELGISLTDDEGNMKSLSEVMGDLRTSFATLDESQQSAYAATIFGKEAMAGALAIITASEEDYNGLADAINESSGAAEEMAAIMSDNLEGRMAAMKSAMSEVGLVIYEALKPALEKVVSLITSLANGFNNLSPTMQTIIIIIGVVAAALGPLLLLIGGAIIFTGMLTGACTTLGISLTALLLPIAGVIAAIIGIIAVLVIFWDEIQTGYNTYFKPIMDAIIDIIMNTVVPAFKEGFNTMANIVSEVFGVIKRLWNEILKPVLEFIVSYIQTYVLPGWEVAFNGIANVVSFVFGTIGDLWENSLKPIFNGIIDFITGVFTGNWSKAWEGVVSIFGGIFEGLKTLAKAPINAVISLVNGLIGGLNNFQVPDWVPKIGGKGINIPTIPLLATGGTLGANGSAIVGEAGPELLSRSGSSVKVTPLSRDEKKAGIGGALGNTQQQQPIILQMNDRVVGEVIAPVVNEFTNRKTVRLNKFTGSLTT